MLRLFVVASAGFYGFTAWQKQSRSRPLRVAVLGRARRVPDAASGQPHPPRRARGATGGFAPRAVANKQLDGLLA